jgi:hypothetical protein
VHVDSPATGQPAVSVLVTTYNHAPFVWECLESLAAQTCRDFEIIITDDASSDGTADLIQTWLNERCSSARFLRNRVNRGICANRNTALSFAGGQFLCSLSGDDAYEPERIERQLECFRGQPPDVAVVYSDMRMINARGRDLGMTFLDYHLGMEPPPEGNAFARLLRGSFIPAPAAMIRRSCLDLVGPYDESLFHEDYDMWLRLSARFRFHHLSDCLVRYRILPTSMSHSSDLRPAMSASTLRILQSWQGHCGEAEAALLWSIGLRQIQQHQDSEALRNLTLAAQSRGPRHRFIARALQTPGACAAARSIHRVIQLARAMRLRWYLTRAN